MVDHIITTGLTYPFHRAGLSPGYFSISLKPSECFLCTLSGWQGRGEEYKEDKDGQEGQGLLSVKNMRLADSSYFQDQPVAILKI